jgi:hypothetical protein
MPEPFSPRPSVGPAKSDSPCIDKQHGNNTGGNRGKHPDFVPWPDLQISAARVRKAILANGYAQKYADHINSVFLRLLPFDGDRPAGRSIPAAEGLKPFGN